MNNVIIHYSLGFVTDEQDITSIEVYIHITLLRLRFGLKLELGR